MKVATKLSGAFGLLVFLLAASSIYHIRTMGDAVAASYDLSDIHSRLVLSSNRLMGWLDQLEENAGKYWVTRDRGYLEKFGEAVDGFDRALRRLDSPSLGARERREVDGLAASWAEFRPAAGSFGDAVAAQGFADAAPIEAVYRRIESLRYRTRRAADASQERMVSRLQASAAAARRTERLSWGAIAGALLLSVLVSVLIVRSIADALARLKEGTRQVAAGNFAYRLDAQRDDEFAQLARDFNVMTRRLGELDRTKRDFLSKVSHDLKTPLASMQEATQILLDEVPGPLTEKQRRMLGFHRQSGRRLAAMIAKILDLAGLEAGNAELEVREHDLVPLVHAALAAVDAGLRERRIRLETDLPAAPLLVPCDADRVVQVLVNLLENALKFTPESGVIRVITRFCADRPDGVPLERWRALGRPQPGPGAALIAVEDSGRGVPEDERERIFERFYQTSHGRRVRGHGVGLGLAICREIVEAHRGVIWATDAPGGGSAFMVLLAGARTARESPAGALAGVAP